MSEIRLSFSLPSKPGEASVLPATKSSPLAHQSDPTRPHSPPYLWKVLKISRIRCWILFIGVLPAFHVTEDPLELWTIPWLASGADHLGQNFHIMFMFWKSAHILEEYENED